MNNINFSSLNSFYFPVNNGAMGNSDKKRKLEEQEDLAKKKQCIDTNTALVDNSNNNNQFVPNDYSKQKVTFEINGQKQSFSAAGLAQKSSFFQSIFSQPISASFEFSEDFFTRDPNYSFFVLECCEKDADTSPEMNSLEEGISAYKIGEYFNVEHIRKSAMGYFIDILNEENYQGIIETIGLDLDSDVEKVFAENPELAFRVLECCENETSFVPSSFEEAVVVYKLANFFNLNFSSDCLKIKEVAENKIIEEISPSNFHKITNKILDMDEIAIAKICNSICKSELFSSWSKLSDEYFSPSALSMMEFFKNNAKSIESISFKYIDQEDCFKRFVTICEVCSEIKTLTIDFLPPPQQTVTDVKETVLKVLKECQKLTELHFLIIDDCLSVQDDPELTALLPHFKKLLRGNNKIIFSNYDE